MAELTAASAGTTAGTAKEKSASAKLSPLQLLVFGFPALPHSFIALPLYLVIPAFYAAHTAVTLTQIGVFTSSSRVLDAVLDPLVGFLSDRFDTPWGKRKPWIVAAGFVCGLSLFFLFQPPKDATITYYGVWSFALLFGFSLFEIPRSAWSAEISRDYTERTRINNSIAQFNVIGSLVFWLVPIALYQLIGTTQITGTSLSAIAWLYLLMMPAGILFAAWLVPNGIPVVQRAVRIIDILKSLISNRPLITYSIAYGLWALGQGFSFSVIMIFLNDRMKLGALFPFLMIGLFTATTLGIPVWMKLVPKIGRHRVWALSLFLSAVTRPLILLFAPGAAAAVPMLILTCLNGFVTAPWNFAPPSMLSDVIDYDLWKSGSNKAGNLFAVNTLLVKVTMAFGAGGAFILLDMFQYHIGKTNTGLGDVGLILCYAVLPGIFHIMAAVLGWYFPLDARRQTIVRRRLESRKTQTEATPPEALVPAQ